MHGGLRSLHPSAQTMAETMSVELAEVPTSALIEELKSRSQSSVILLNMVGEGGASSYQYYRDGDIITCLGLVTAQKKTILNNLEVDDLDDED